MKKIAILILLVSCLACAAAEPNYEKLARAIAQIESSNRPQVFGDNGLAWGLYQFHKARYLELGGKAYGKADSTEQTRIILKEIALVDKRRGNIDLVRAIGTYHNIGSIKNLETDYVKKLRFFVLTSHK